MSSSVPYRSVVGTSGLDVLPFSDPDKSSISGHRTALPIENRLFPVIVCQICQFSHSESCGSCSSINGAVASVARRRPSLCAVASQKMKLRP